MRPGRSHRPTCPPVLPADLRDYARVLWFDAYAGGTIFRHVVHPLFAQTIVGPNIRNVPTDKAVVNEVLTNVQPKILGARFPLGGLTPAMAATFRPRLFAHGWKCPL